MCWTANWFERQLDRSLSRVIAFLAVECRDQEAPSIRADSGPDFALP